ncbi:MAG: DNA polymerase III subunit gamma/tau C-terminal domain-containing protein, partial [Gammaproteobacteria bacterium]
LLKTLEEPPEHVKFLLATTDPKRLPITVLSRCLQFHLKNLSPEIISQHLENILKKENIPGEPAALQAISRAATGSVRDALSLLDGAIAYGAGHVLAADVAHMLGTVEKQRIQELLTALADKNLNAVLLTCRQMATQAIDFSSVLEELLSLLHQIAVIQALPTMADDTFLINLAKHISPEDTQLWYQIGLIGRRDLPLAPSPLSGFEMVMLRMLVFSPVPVSTPTLRQESGEHTANPENLSWPEILPHLQLNGLSHTLATHCSLVRLEPNCIQLALSPAHTALFNPKSAERIEHALTHYFKRPIKLQVDTTAAPLNTPQQEALKTLESDASLQVLLKTFDATIQPETITHKINTHTRNTS